MVGYFRIKPTDVVRIFAGQADPVDRSHFTISYTVNGKKGLIDGNLQPDGKNVVFALRPGGPLLAIPVHHHPARCLAQLPPQSPKPAATRRGQAIWMTYQAPPDQLVLFQDKVDRLFGDLRYEESAESNKILDTNPDCVVSYCSGDANWIVGRVNSSLDSFLSGGGTARAPAFGGDRGPLLYCGARDSRAGERLVTLSFYSKRFWTDAPTPHEAFTFSADVFRPAGKDHPFFRISSQSAIEIGYYRSHDGDVIRFFAGQPDPNDPSHFTIRYVMNGNEGIIDGNLQPDGKTVVVGARGGGPMLDK